jgi:hypothetical protein
MTKVTCLLMIVNIISVVQNSLLPHKIQFCIYKTVSVPLGAPYLKYEMLSMMFLRLVKAANIAE